MLTGSWKIGYVYCMSNLSMPGLVKIGCTENDRDPSFRLAEANQSDTFRPPDPYVLEFAKQVSDPRGKERTIHSLLSDERVNPKREFFRISIEKTRLIFTLMEGEWWERAQAGATARSSRSVDTSIDPRKLAISVPLLRIQSGPDRDPIDAEGLVPPDPADVDEGTARSESMSTEMASRTPRNRKKLLEYLVDGQRIRHIINRNTLIGTYCRKSDGILVAGHRRSNIYEFVHGHEDDLHVPRKGGNHWKACECEVEGRWINANDLPLLSSR